MRRRGDRHQFGDALDNGATNPVSMPLVQALAMDYVVLWRLGRLQARASESEAKALALYRELLKCAEAMPRSFTQAKSTRCFANPGEVAAFRPIDHLPGSRA